MPHVGGGSHAHELLRPLEQLSSIEETIVRTKAVESLNKVCTEMSAEDVQEHFIPLVLKLAEGEWFTSRVSACSLFARRVPSTASIRSATETLSSEATSGLHCSEMLPSW